MEQTKKIRDMDESIKEMSTELSRNLKEGFLTGYSFFDINISKNSEGLEMKASIGLAVVINGDKNIFGANAVLRRGGKTKDYAKVCIDYEFSVGRDLKTSYHDECSNNPTNKGSINGIKLTDSIFLILCRMTDDIYKDSPMPMLTFSIL